MSSAIFFPSGSTLRIFTAKTASSIGCTDIDDAMNSIIRYSKLAGAVLAGPNTRGYFDFKDVVLLADQIARGPVELGQRMEVLYGQKSAVVSLEDSMGRAVELGIESVVVSYFKVNVVTFPYFGKPQAQSYSLG
ncbi:hypothetical protein Hte_007068 [Hypoxylon texense]